MIEDLKPYAEYKDSGLPWLGEVPCHWEVLPALGAFKPKYVFRGRDGSRRTSALLNP
jgi:type I restriction enzyme S subunit